MPIADLRAVAGADEPKSTGPLPEAVLDIIELQHPSPSADIRRLVTEVRSLRAVLNDLLLTRQAHEEASDAELLLAGATTGGDFDPDADRECVIASERTAEAALAHEAAWDRARSLLAGEEKP